jgi:hypothetical protein
MGKVTIIFSKTKGFNRKEKILEGLGGLQSSEKAYATANPNPRSVSLSPIFF